MISLTLPLVFLASCGSSGGEKLFDGSTGGASSRGGANAQSGAAIGNGGSLSAGSGGAGMSGASSRGGAGTAAGANSGGSTSLGAAAGRLNASSGSPAGGTDATAGMGTTEGGSDAGGASGGTSQGGTDAVGGALTGGVGGALSTGGAGGGGAIPCTPVDERCDGLDNSCNGVVDEGKACPTKCEGFAIEGTGYMYCSTLTNLAKGETACEAQGLRVAWIETAQENEALSSTLVALTESGPQGPMADTRIYARLGATDAEEEGAWHWIGGVPFWTGSYKGKAVGGAYENWASTEPNDNDVSGEDCVTFVINEPLGALPGEWNDVPCSEVHPVLCETP